jgi:Uri superfamily endonuclease
VGNKGVYVIWLHLPKRMGIAIGKLGTFDFEPGIYAYAGSAQRNLEQRVARHSHLDKKLHWHIDYLRVKAEFLGAALFYNQTKISECWLAQALLRLPGATLPAAGFGSSDCRCRAHLVQVPLALLQSRLVLLSDSIHDIDLGAAQTLALLNAGD